MFSGTWVCEILVNVELSKDCLFFIPALAYNFVHTATIAALHAGKIKHLQIFVSIILPRGARARTEAKGPFTSPLANIVRGARLFSCVRAG